MLIFFVIEWNIWNPHDTLVDAKGYWRSCAHTPGLIGLSFPLFMHLKTSSCSSLLFKSLHSPSLTEVLSVQMVYLRSNFRSVLFTSPSYFRTPTAKKKKNDRSIYLILNRWWDFISLHSIVSVKRFGDASVLKSAI